LQLDLLWLELTRKNRFSLVVIFPSLLHTSVSTIPSYLGTVDIYGTPIVNDFIATGIGEHLVKPLMAKVFFSFPIPRLSTLPLLNRHLQKQPELQIMTRDEAKAFLMECMSILYMRSCAAYSEVYHPSIHLSSHSPSLSFSCCPQCELVTIHYDAEQDATVVDAPEILTVDTTGRWYSPVTIKLPL
jgi:hypothetical protein